MAETGALREALRLAQRGEGEAALALRRHALGLEAAPDARGVDKVDVGARFRALAALDPLRDPEAPLTPAGLEAALAGLDLRGAPDLARAAERLRVAARVAARLEELGPAPGVDVNLWKAVVGVLRAAPARASLLRSYCVTMIPNSRVGPGHVPRALARLRAEVPDVERFEGPWLQALEGAAQPAPSPGDPSRYLIAALYLGYKGWSWAAQATAAVRE